MRDVLPVEAHRLRTIEARAVGLLQRFGYEEIRLPLLEPTELFSRSVGEGTDIVEKQMYTFDDRDGDSVTLRPEGTASCVRACLQHGLIHNQARRLWYTGTMFRYERPQRGRYRQFEQVGAEAFGMPGPDVDAELIDICATLFRELGVIDDLRLEINTLGSSEDRARYRAALVDYLTPHASALDEDSERRLTRNPLRILDSKDAGTQRILEGAPSMRDYVGAESRAYFATLGALLARLGIPFNENPRLVRGLDYYTHTVFEWITDALGAQGTVCGGGRYDLLVELLGGKPTPGCGFAIGLDRVGLLVEAVASGGPGAELDSYCVVMEDRHTGEAMALARALRAAGLSMRVHMGGGKLKAQLKRADASGARVAVILGDDELASGVVSLKWLREDRPQEQVRPSELAARLARSA
jgi:histidyl-tRNA synthetase